MLALDYKVVEILSYKNHNAIHGNRILVERWQYLAEYHHNNINIPLVFIKYIRFKTINKITNSRLKFSK